MSKRAEMASPVYKWKHTNPEPERWRKITAGEGSEKRRAAPSPKQRIQRDAKKLGDVFQRLDAGLHAAPLIVGDRCPADVQDLRHLFL